VQGSAGIAGYGSLHTCGQGVGVGVGVGSGVAVGYGVGVGAALPQGISIISVQRCSLVGSVSIVQKKLFLIEPPANS
jgi:hypothetical protein